MYQLPNIKGKTTEEKIQSIVSYLYMLVEELNRNESINVFHICTEIDRILKTDNTALIGNSNAKAHLENKESLKKTIKSISEQVR